MKLGSLSWILSCRVCLAVAYSQRWESPQKRDSLLPTEDPFYAAPGNLSDYEPGTIIRWRHPPAQVGIYGFKANLADAWQLLYRTTGAVGEPLATVTTVLVPHDANFEKVLSYQVEIDAPYSGCFPSYTLQQPNANVADISAQYGELWFVSALARGWVVAVPDYEGPRAAFANGKLGGQAVLDGLRAVVRSESITGVSPRARLAIWGYSGGAQATEFALELQTSYAPELSIIAGAMGGLPVNFGAAFPHMNKEIGAGVAPAAVLGLARADPKLQAVVDDLLFPNNKSEFLKVEQQCIVPTVVQFAYLDIFSYFKGGKSALDNPVLNQTLQAATMGQINTKIKVPLYMYHATQDELLPIAEVDKLVQSLCDSGASVQYVRESFGEHIFVAITGAAGALKFLIDRMDGQSLNHGCSTKTIVTSAIDPKNIPVLGGIIFNYIVTLLGRPIGPKAWIEAASS